MKQGIHIIANFFECRNKELLVNEEKLSRLIVNSVNENGLTILKKYFHKFGEGGITGYLLLSESHVSIHTWPERNNYLTLDIFVCNYNKDNTEDAKKIFNQIKEAFNPENSEETFLERD